MASGYGPPDGINAKEDRRRRGLIWILAKISSSTRWPSPGTGCSGQWWSDHTWRDLTDVDISLGHWFSGGRGSAAGMVWLDDLEGLF